ITHLEPRSLASEAYRSLRTNIQIADQDRGAKAYLITSSGPGEGKTITLANLAITMAQMGSKTLLVETDLRRPLLHSVFGQDKEPGLTNLLREEIEWTSVVRETGVQNLHLIPSGPLPPNPSELLGSNKMASIIEEL
ncbi:MAG: CpsD/CapB family tyrosine-protein kinase, partial [candidate division NC10 bacterium]|nr:CpsD/CapB family tyrosine-protein kinase [candidate division NC10 bacterium]